MGAHDLESVQRCMNVLHAAKATTPERPPSKPEPSKPEPPKPEPTGPRTPGRDPNGAQGNMSQGTAIQFAGRGPQDVYLTGNPEITFFRQSYLRHTPFAMEAFEDRFASPFGFDKINVCRIIKHGDVLGSMYLRVVLPDLGVTGTWKPRIGYVLLVRARLKIGTLVVQDFERLWYDIHDQLFESKNVTRMVGKDPLSTRASHELLIPLKFVENIPVCSLGSTSEIFVEIETPSLSACVDSAAVLPPLATLEAEIVSHHVFLGRDELTRFVSRPHHLMLDLVQDVDEVSYKVSGSEFFATSDVYVDLRELNSPVKYLAIVAYDEKVDEYFVYINSIRSMVMTVGSTNYMEPREFGYYSLVQTYDKGLWSDSSNIGLLSFALDATSPQPRGTLNFSRLSNPVLRCSIAQAGGNQSVQSVQSVKVKAFAVCVNWLDFEGGACTLRYVA